MKKLKHIKLWESFLNDKNENHLDSNNIDQNAILNGYLNTALWSSPGEEEENDEESDLHRDSPEQNDALSASEILTGSAPEVYSEPSEFFDGDHDIDDFSDKAIDQAKHDIALFVAKAGDLLIDLDENMVGHDFWLTRAGHGAGFWDGDYHEEIGQKLTAISKEFKPVDLIKGDDGKLYFE